CTRGRPRLAHNCSLHICLHTAETNQYRKHLDRRDPGCDSADDWVGGGTRTSRRWGLECVCDSVFLADAAFLCACLAVSGGTSPRIIRHVHCLSAAFAHCARRDEIMKTASLPVERGSSLSALAWKTTLILIPFVTAALLLWLRHVEVRALAQRTVSSYGTVPS